MAPPGACTTLGQKLAVSGPRTTHTGARAAAKSQASKGSLMPKGASPMMGTTRNRRRREDMAVRRRVFATLSCGRNSRHVCRHVFTSRSCGGDSRHVADTSNERFMALESRSKCCYKHRFIDNYWIRKSAVLTKIQSGAYFSSKRRL